MGERYSVSKITFSAYRKARCSLIYVPGRFLSRSGNVMSTSRAAAPKSLVPLGVLICTSLDIMLNISQTQAVLPIASKAVRLL